VVFTEHCGRVVNTPSYSGCIRFKSRLGDQLVLLSFRGFLRHSRRILGQYLKIRSRLLPSTSFPIYNFIYSYFIRHYIVWVTYTSLNKLQIGVTPANCDAEFGITMFPETLLPASIYKSTRRHGLENHHPNFHRRENLISHVLKSYYLLAWWYLALGFNTSVWNHSLMMEAVRTSETSIYFYQTTRCHIPEGCHLHTWICLYQPW
jgi:hypothetical protein